MEERHQGSIPNVTTTGVMVIDKARQDLASPIHVYHLILCFYTSNSELVVVRSNSFQNTSCSCTFLCICPHSGLVAYSVLSCKLGKDAFSSQWSAAKFLALLFHWSSTILHWPAWVPFPKPGTNTANPPSKPLLIHHVAARMLPPLLRHLALADVFGLHAKLPLLFE